MKKRHIALVIAGLVVGAAGVAAENLEVLPFSSRDAYAPEAAQFESVPADVAVVEVTPVEVVPVEVVPVESVQVAAVEPVVVASAKPAMISSIPQSADDMVWKPLPAQAKYFEDREAQLQVAAATRGDSFPQSADDLVWKPLPVQAKYLDDRAAQIQVATVRSETIQPAADVIVMNPVPPIARY